MFPSHAAAQAHTQAPCAVQHGEEVRYICQGEVLLAGSVHIDSNPAHASGILCSHCNEVISCSGFEAHAGRGSRRSAHSCLEYDARWLYDAAELYAADMLCLPRAAAA